MWRGKSDGDDKSKQSRGGSGQSKGRTAGRQSQQSARRGGSNADPRSKSTGKKIRRIESGSPGAQSGGRRDGASPIGGSRDGGSGRRPADQTEIGRPPSGPPDTHSGRDPQMGRPPSDLSQPMPQAFPSGSAPSLPPLTQPTGELPKVPVEVATDDDKPREQVSAFDLVGGSSSFGAAQEPAAGETVMVTGTPGSDGVFSERGEDSSASQFNSPVPSAIPVADDPFAIADDATGVMPAGGFDADAVEFVDKTDADLAEVESQLANARADNSPTNPFSDPTMVEDFADAAPAVAGRSFDDAVGARAEMGRPLAAGVSVAASRQQAGRQLDAPSSFPGQDEFGHAPRSSSRPDPRHDDDAGRLQDTEFKLADKRRKQKPKEPNRLILALAMGLVVLVGVAVAWFLTRGDGGDATESADGTAETAAEPEVATQAEATDTLPAADPEPQVDEPTLFFEEAQTGPLEQGATYSIDLVGEPEGSMLQVVVDGIQQGTPDLLLPDLILPAGRHTLLIEITNGAEVTQSTPVDVYVLGDLPPQGYRANLSSVDIQNEGWVEAVRRFDEFRAAGHDGLQLAPLSDGYWNLFIAGLGEDRAAAQAYCESFALAVPDQCFPTYYEGGAAPTETTAAESMTDDADDANTSTSAAGG